MRRVVAQMDTPASEARSVTAAAPLAGAALPPRTAVRAASLPSEHAALRPQQRLRPLRRLAK